MLTKLATNIDFHDDIVATDREAAILPGGYAARNQMHEYINATILGNVAIDFLEFGVYRGDSLRSWLGLNKNPQSKFYRFDSFTGLPAQWRKNAKGTFDVGRQSSGKRRDDRLRRRRFDFIDGRPAGRGASPAGWRPSCKNTALVAHPVDAPGATWE